MASLYKKASGIYYLSVKFQGKRMTRSLGTRFIKTASDLAPDMEKTILLSLLGANGEEAKKELSFKQCVELYLSEDHNWKPITRQRYRYLMNNYMANGLPDNPTTLAMTIRTVNACNRWSKKKRYIKSYTYLKGGSNFEMRTRVLSEHELALLFTAIKDKQFRDFVQLAYCTGARSGEIRCIPRENIKNGHIVVNGKTGERMVKLNSQAQVIIKQQDILWSYSKDFVSHKFKKEVRRLGIKDARFHDLRRTFGLNLIKQGMSIYKVSKLLGHSSVRTTEQHYAPLLTVEIEDFIL